MATKLKIVTAQSPGLDPPRALGAPGLALWASVRSQYDIRDAGGVEMLAQACAALDRAESLSAEIAQDGQIIRTKQGPKVHPALRDELSNRAFVVRTLQRLGLDVEAVRSIGRPTTPLGVTGI